MAYLVQDHQKRARTKNYTNNSLQTRRNPQGPGQTELTITVVSFTFFFFLLRQALKLHITMSQYLGFAALLLSMSLTLANKC
jgi:hypothetical protein